MYSKHVLLACLAVGSAACLGEPIQGTLTTEGSTPPAPERVDVSATPTGDGTLVPPPVTPEAPTRIRRRMDIDQLDTSIRQVTGGIGWVERRGNAEVNLFQELAGTLGKPDYIQQVDEDLDPSAMFQKFLDDAARSVCDRLIDSDPQRPQNERVFFTEASPATTLAREPAAVRANLQYLLLRFHGRKLTADAPELKPWLWLVESAEHVGASAPEMWRTVCVGLMTHPDFYTY